MWGVTRAKVVGPIRIVDLNSVEIGGIVGIGGTEVIGVEIEAIEVIVVNALRVAKHAPIGRSIRPGRRVVRKVDRVGSFRVIEEIVVIGVIGAIDSSWRSGPTAGMVG